MKNLKFLLLYGLVAMILIIFLPGCKQYYKVSKVNFVTSAEITSYIAEKKFIIIHQEKEARCLFNPYLSENILSGNLINLTVNQLKYKTTKIKGSNRYRKTINFDESDVIKEVHLYLGKAYIKHFETASLVNIPLSEIAYSDIYNKDKTATLLSWGGTAALGIIGGIVLIEIIAHAMKDWFVGTAGR